MIIKECVGYELVKEKSNSPQDHFNRSEVSYIEDGREKKLYVLYVKYFEELLAEQESLHPLFTIREREVFIKDVVALIYLMKNAESKERKRIYISSQELFSEIFENIDYNQIKLIFQTLAEQRDCTI
ncbi:hypothetical protein [Bacillus sp. JJ722]|uniref:hypothetical protein n=1 Tax=Bacillus sp. JJ722 TaxID=3122973 RepID=UPI002FFDD1C1